MKIIFEDGTSQECALNDQPQIVYGELLVLPQSIPKCMKLIWEIQPLMLGGWVPFGAGF